MYDLDTVKKYAASKNISHLIPYETFLKDSPRKLLVAQHKCVGLSWCIPCGHEQARERGLTFSRMNGFEMVDNTVNAVVCNAHQTQSTPMVCPHTNP